MSERRVVFAPAFTHDFRLLQKRYRRIGEDLRPLLDQLKRGETPGDQIPGVGYTVYKARLKNRDAQRGKSGGYRAVYFLEKADQIVMITIYSKSDQSDIPLDVLRQIIKEYVAEPPHSNE